VDSPGLCAQETKEIVCGEMGCVIGGWSITSSQHFRLHGVPIFFVSLVRRMISVTMVTECVPGDVWDDSLAIDVFNWKVSMTQQLLHVDEM